MNPSFVARSQAHKTYWYHSSLTYHVLKQGSRKETKRRECVYRDTTNVEHEKNDYNKNNWSHQNSNNSFKEKV